MRAHFHPGNPFGRSLNIQIRKHAAEKFQIVNLAFPHSFNGIICSPPLASFVFQDNCGSRIIFGTLQFLPLNFPRLRRLKWPLSKSLTKKQTKLTIIKVKARFVAHKSAKTMHRIFQLAFLWKLRPLVFLRGRLLTWIFTASCTFIQMVLSSVCMTSAKFGVNIQFRQANKT